MKPNESTELIYALIDGVFEKPLWSTFLDRLRKYTNADYASLVFRPKGLASNTVFHLYSGNRCPPVIQQLYRDSFYKEDPTPYHEMLEGYIYALEELLCKDNPVHAKYLSTVMQPSGMNTARMLRVSEESGVSAWLTITRSKPDFCKNDEELLLSILPYLRKVLRSFIALERERTRAALAEDAIQRLCFGWLTLDPYGKVLENDPRAETILNNSGILTKDKKGFLKSNIREKEQELKKIIALLAKEPDAKPQAVVLSREPWIDMLLVRAGQDVISAKSAPAVIAYVHNDNALSSEHYEQLSQLFNLLPSEARLALSLARGLSIQEAAHEHNLSVESARTYSKRIYSKMGARGQSDLVRFVQRSILQIA